MSEAAYNKAIVDTFRLNALRTAHIIDDSFPTYGQLAANENAKELYKEWELAVELYDLFRKHQIPCDVENTIQSIQGDVERVRKSDLIVLDYNLAPGDTRMSVSLVRDLARTKHFNTIIVYTAADNLNEVWLNFAAALHGGWSVPSLAETEADVRLGALSDEGVVLDAPTAELMGDYIVGRALGARNANELKEYAAVLEQAGVLEAERDLIVRARIRAEIRTFLADDKQSQDAALQAVDGRFASGKPLWLQSGNCFVTIMGKPQEGKKSIAADKLFDRLDEALCDWRPNLLQILISEIQNVLESDAIATHELHLRDPHTQVSLCYFLLLALSDGEAGRAREALDGPVHTLLDKLVEGVRHKLVTDDSLQGLGGDLLASEIGRLNIPDYGADRSAKRRGLFSLAQKMAGSKEEQDAQQALLKLNAFLSSEPFRGGLTTGTVFTDGTTHWMCMTPACDMVNRPPSPDQEWLLRLHPMKPIVAARLKAKDAARALKEAEFSKNLFLHRKEGMLVFDVISDAGGPNYEFIYLDGVSIIKDGVDHTFKGYRVWKNEGVKEMPSTLEKSDFKVIGQIRSDYASRFLQQTGAWLSRIGVDFIRAAT